MYRNPRNGHPPRVVFRRGLNRKLVKRASHMTTGPNFFDGTGQTQAISFLQSRAGPARFERRPTIMKQGEFMVGRRGEAPLVPPYILPSFKKALALGQTRSGERSRNR